MPHWADKVVALLNATTADLRELALLAGGDPKTFYRGIKVGDLELTEQDDIRGMEFGETTEADLAHAASISALAKRGISISAKTMGFHGSIGEIDFSYDIAYPWFVGAADFSTVNKRFADAAETAANNATPKSDDRNDSKQTWNYEQRFAIYQPSSNSVTVAVDFHGYSGGAHGYGARHCTLVNVNVGKIVSPDDFFAMKDKWLEYLIEFVTADLKLQFIERPGFDDALKPESLRKILREGEHYCWQADKLILIFNSYEVGPYAAGPYNVEIPYKDLRALLPAGWGLPTELTGSADAAG
jgi:Protein of unknown function (DUF3298)